MPFPFTLPTTSNFSFSQAVSCDSHPSLPLAASTYRGVLKETLKKHKLLPSAEQASHLSSVAACLDNYIPYLIAIDLGLGSQAIAGQTIDVVLKSNPTLEWRPTLSQSLVPGREVARIQINSIEFEIYFTLSTLAYCYTLLSRIALNPLHSQSKALPSPAQRTLSITTATKHLLSAASIHEYLSLRSEQLSTQSSCIDISQATFKALASLALAEATLLAVLKDDPYPAAVARDRNKVDKEWMIKGSEIPKVRAHLFARLCLAAADHAAHSLSLLKTLSSNGQGRYNPNLLSYIKNLQRCSRGKACRFFGIDAELGGQTGIAIAWLHAGMYQLEIASEEEQPLKSLGRLKKSWVEKREEKKVDKGAHWGSDAGRLEEGRILEILDQKWSKINDTINAQPIPEFGPLLSTMPSGRNIHSLKPFIPSTIDTSVLDSLQASCLNDDVKIEHSSDGEEASIATSPKSKRDQLGNENYF